MARTCSAAVTAAGDNTAFPIEVSDIGTIVPERSVDGTKRAVDRETGEMSVFSNIAGSSVAGTAAGQQLRVSYDSCTEVSFETLQ